MTERDRKPCIGGPALIEVRPYLPKDHAEWLHMRSALWPEVAAGGHEQQESDEWLAREDTVVIVAQLEGEDGLVGFAEAGERAYADGCETSPVAFLEAWYVDPHVRNHHVGRGLVAAVQAWARERGYRELASDSLLENAGAHAAHLAVGFEEVERAIRYRKTL